MAEFLTAGGAVAAALAALLGGRALARCRGEGHAVTDAVERLEGVMARREEALEGRERALRAREDALARRQEEVRSRLGEVASLSPSEARRHLLAALEVEFDAERTRRVQGAIEAARAEADERARDIVLTAIHRLAVGQCKRATVARVALPSPEWAGRVIGREGRNVKAFEAATGCDVLVEEGATEVVLSCFDAGRREVARRALARLLGEGRLQPERIESVVQEERARLETESLDVGRGAAREAGVSGLPDALLVLLGRLRFRTSYGQDALRHAIETALLAGILAVELGLDEGIARRAGLLHDLGKVVDAREGGRHDAAPARLPAPQGEETVVAEAVAGHHEAGEVERPYAALVQVADAISAARPGARRESVERYVERLREIEEIAASIPGVVRAWALRAGRVLRVLVDPDVVDDDGARRLAYETARALERRLGTAGEIRVTAIREVRATDVAR
ncbi:MAG: Rnase Y domain-containing protein [Planctomycetota bacterium]